MNDMNRLFTCKNPYQGDAKRVLCVCSAGLLRSPTAAVVLQREFGFNTRAAGANDYALIPVDAILIHWADEIVCMEDIHFQTLEMRFPLDMTDKPVKVLAIPDRFSYMKESLQESIKEVYQRLENPGDSELASEVDTQ